MDAKPLRINFDKVNGVIRIYNGISYLKLFYSDNEIYYGINSIIHSAIFDRINYLISEKSGITDGINPNFTRIRIDSYSSLPIKKALIFHNVIILIKSVVPIKVTTTIIYFSKKVHIRNPTHNK